MCRRSRQAVDTFRHNVRHNVTAMQEELRRGSVSASVSLSNQHLTPPLPTVLPPPLRPSWSGPRPSVCYSAIITSSQELPSLASPYRGSYYTVKSARVCHCNETPEVPFPGHGSTVKIIMSNCPKDRPLRAQLRADCLNARLFANCWMSCDSATLGPRGG